mmetsp:Transcript_20767/g.39304  ORF Transcript_20767/g.39304 Transcript_20767/m.39304 type:complete len:225 (+) Transcript_20767:1076-1750(+)
MGTTRDRRSHFCPFGWPRRQHVRSPEKTRRLSRKKSSPTATTALVAFGTCISPRDAFAVARYMLLVPARRVNWRGHGRQECLKKRGREGPPRDQSNNANERNAEHLSFSLTHRSAWSGTPARRGTTSASGRWTGCTNQTCQCGGQAGRRRRSTSPRRRTRRGCVWPGSACLGRPAECNHSRPTPTHSSATGATRVSSQGHVGRRPSTGTALWWGPGRCRPSIGG